MADVTFDYTEFKCPMPVMRYRYNEESDTRSSYVGSCGEELFVEHRHGAQLLHGGPMDCYDWWRVNCNGGHVLMVPDTEGNDYEIPFEFDAFTRAIGYIVDLIHPLRSVET